MLVTPELVALFNALPTPQLLLSPTFVIKTASDAYLHATLTSRERLVGQYLFDAFPNNPQTPAVNGKHHMRTSLAQVLATKQPQQIVHQHYDVPDPASSSSVIGKCLMFGLFQRLHTHVEGTGVDLYITKRLLENAGGPIAVAN